MEVADLQTCLARDGLYPGLIDNDYGKLTEAAVMRGMTEGPDTRLTDADFAESAERLQAPAAAIKAVWRVESAGQAFIDGRPALLFEPHRFSRATLHRFDQSHPSISYPAWDPKRYPRDQAARYLQLVQAVGLDVDAGFASASYGGPQILGENYVACGFATSFAFARAMAFDEERQLMAFEAFVTNRGLLKALRALDWSTFARGYNGTGYRVNAYDVKLAAAYTAARGQA